MVTGTKKNSNIPTPGVVQGAQSDSAPCKSSPNTRWGLSGEVKELEAYLGVLGCLHFVKPHRFQISYCFAVFSALSVI